MLAPVPHPRAAVLVCGSVAEFHLVFVTDNRRGRVSIDSDVEDRGVVRALMGSVARIVEIIGNMQRHVIFCADLVSLQIFERLFQSRGGATAIGNAGVGAGAVIAKLLPLAVAALLAAPVIPAFLARACCGALAGPPLAVGISDTGATRPSAAIVPALFADAIGLANAVPVLTHVAGRAGTTVSSTPVVATLLSGAIRLADALSLQA